MKNLKYILIFILSLGIFNSCLVEDESDIDANDSGYNLAAFNLGSKTVAGISDGSEYTFYVDLRLVGPTYMDVNNDITVEIGVHESSTAIAGKHFRIDDPTVVLQADQNHLAKFEFTMLTDGIFAPLAEAPVLVLEMLSATGDENVTNTGKLINITLSYQCFSDLAGDYIVEVSINGTPQDPVALYLTDVVTITQTGVGQYRTDQVGHWDQADLGGTPGYTFFDECNNITIPGQNLVDLYSNWVEGSKVGSVTEDGVITTEYTITASSWSAANTYANTYTPVTAK